MMKRRTFLASSLATGLAATAARAKGLSGVGDTNLVVVVTDIDASTPPAQFEAFLTGLTATFVPCVLVLDPATFAVDSLLPDNPLAKLLRQVWDRSPGVIQLAPMVRDLQDQRPYFQSRAASLAIAQLIEMLGLSDSVEAGRRITTLACELHRDATPIDGIRCTGIRTLMTLPKSASAPVQALQSKSGVLQMIGGKRLDLSPTGFEQAALTEGTLNIQVVSARDFRAMAVADLARETRRFCQGLRQQELHGDVVLSLPQDVLIRDGNVFERQVALHVFAAAPNVPAEQAAVKAFMAELDQANVPFSSGPAPTTQRTDYDRLAFWIDETEPSELAGFWLSPFETVEPPAGPGTCIVLPEKRRGWRGFNDAGQLLLPLALTVDGAHSTADLLRELGQFDDTILLVHPAAIMTVAQRKNLLRALRGLHEDGVSVLLGLSAMVGRILPADNLLSLYRRTEANVPQLLPLKGPITAEHREALMQDAKSAWSYFTELTSTKTGLCISTFEFGSEDTDQYDQVTMWDVASQINAIIAASDLGLIEDADFKKQIARILKHTKGKKIEGLLLPPEGIATRTGRSTSNFNASDTCRLLGSLAHLARHRLGDAKALQAMVSAWDLDAVIVEGKLNSLQAGALVPANNSQYAHYSTQCLALWGIKASSPFDGFTNPASTDQKLRLLEVIAGLGPYGAEPMLLEFLDCGPKPPSVYAAQTLFSEQLEAFRRDGQLICPSETPIDHSPWFTYQGLQLDDLTHPWQVQAENAASKGVPTPDQSDLAVSSKAAFLWAGVYQHPLATQLLDYVRERAVTDGGFASCIYAKTGQPTLNYTDVNTNGVILQVIAHILHRDV
jgi:hypothetical protein